MMGGSSGFLSPRYQKRGGHIDHGQKYLIDKPDVSKEIDKIKKNDENHPPILDGRLGDPTQYGLHSYEGFHRHERRYRASHDPSLYEGYQIYGDQALLKRVAEGRWKVSGRLPIPSELKSMVTGGVAGGLALICPALLLPPDRDSGPDNVVVPMWTYSAHMSEPAFSQSDVKICNIDKIGQVNLKHLKETIDENTWALIFATVGNPLSTAMEPDIYASILHIIHEKMREFGHPIPVIADVIYEHFRVDRSKRIDPIRSAIRVYEKEGLMVPVIEVTSFSKMLAIPGYRAGTARILWDERLFYDVRKDFLTSLSALYARHLGQVAHPTQKALGQLYSAINSRNPVEEELAPLATILYSMKELTEMKGAGDTPTMTTDKMIENFMRRLCNMHEIEMNPNEWFTKSKIVKRAKKLAEDSLAGYGVDIGNEAVKILDRLEENRLVDTIEFTLSDEQKEMIYTINSLWKLAKDIDNKDEGKVQERGIFEEKAVKLEEELVRQFKLGEECDQLVFEGSKVLKFYRLKVPVPDIKRKGDRLDLYGISEQVYWGPVESDEFKENEWREIGILCGLPTEDILYQDFKDLRREEVIERVFRFAKAIDDMRRKEGLGVYLLPYYYKDGDPNKELLKDRFNSLYVQWGFTALKKYSPNSLSQAATVANTCYSLGLPIIANTPGELLLPPEARCDGTSCMRNVALQKEEKMKEMLRVIKILALEFRDGSVTSDDDGQIRFKFYPSSSAR